MNIQQRIDIERVIAKIDEKICCQVAEIMNHSSYKQLHSLWLGIEYLLTALNNKENNRNVKIKLLPVSNAELIKDFMKSSEFDQSVMFKLMYTEEYDTPGGQPYSLILLGNSVFSFNSTNKFDELFLLKQMSYVCEAAFCPLLCSPEKSFFGVKKWEDIEQSLSWINVLQTPEYSSWREFQNSTVSRYISLVMPWCVANTGVKYGEHVISDLYWNQADLSPTLFGGAFLFTSILIDSFIKTGWFEKTYGYDEKIGTLGIPRAPCINEHKVHGEFLHSSLHVPYIDEIVEKNLKSIGILSFISSQIYPSGVLTSCHSICAHANSAKLMKSEQTDPTYFSLNYLFCICRFAHYIKIIGRNKTGSFTTATEIERNTQNWLNNYCVSSELSSDELRAKYPLKNADIKIFTTVAKPGVLFAECVLSAHIRNVATTAKVKFITQVVNN